MTELDRGGPHRGRPKPASRRGIGVALVGPDGAGKSTVAQLVVDRLPMRASYLYMGVNLEASTVMLPTTRLALAVKRRRGGGSDMTARPATGNRHRGRLARARGVARMLNWIAEEWFRQVLAMRIQRRGRIAIFDRHFFCDYYASAIAGPKEGRSLDARLHGYVLQRWYPRPDLTIFLDAPVEVLLARKGQDTLEGLSRRRGEYLQLASVLPAFVSVDANRPVDLVADEVVELIVDFLAVPEGREPQTGASGAERPAPSDEPQLPPDLAADDRPTLDGGIAVARP